MTISADHPIHIHSELCSHAGRKRTRTIMRLQFITVGWMVVECSIALSAAWRAHSPALLAFGSDSSVELLSALVVLLQFTSFLKVSAERAARVAGVLLFTLAGTVATTSVAALALKAQPDPSPLGMGVTAVALLIMPALSRAKPKNAKITSNRALAADAVQSATCAYLAALTLLGLVLNAALHIRWVDPVAALIAVPVICVEGRRALRGEVCGCC
jgi:divalent metal cation (Fe/Co/Zn/Cd) transporter